MYNFDSPLPPFLSRSFPVRFLSYLYTVAVRYRNNRFDRNLSLSVQAKRPVISIGGIRAGGTGKTPASLLVGHHLRSLDLPVAFLSRGYRRKNKQQQIVSPHEEVHWEAVGDEPAMIHADLPETWLGIGSDRVASAEKLSSIIPEKTIFVLDDGFQHRKIRRDLDIVCINESTLTDKMLPSGYLREEVSSLKRAHLLFLIGSQN